MLTIGNVFKSPLHSKNSFSSIPKNSEFHPLPFNLNSIYNPKANLTIMLPFIPFWMIPMIPLLKALRTFYSGGSWTMIASNKQKEILPLIPFFNQILELPPSDNSPMQLWNSFLQSLQQIPTHIFYNFNPFSVDLAETLASHSTAQIRINPFEKRSASCFNLTILPDQSTNGSLFHSLETRMNPLYQNFLTLDTIRYQIPNETVKQCVQFLRTHGYQPQLPLITINLQNDYEDGILPMNQLNHILASIPHHTKAFTVLRCHNSTLCETLTRTNPQWLLINEIDMMHALGITALSEVFITTIDDFFAVSMLFRQQNIVLAKSHQQIKQCTGIQFKNQIYLDISDDNHTVTNFQTIIHRQIAKNQD